MTLPWIYLLLAILTEVAGTLTMNASGHSGSLFMYLLMFVFISSSYTLLSFALRKIPIGIAIAIWEASGTSLISSISMFFLNEQISLRKILGLVLAALGMILLHFGEASHND